MFRVVRVGVVLGILVSGFLSAGCGSGTPVALPPETAEDLAHKSKMTEVGLLLSSYSDEKGKPATRVADLAKYENGYPSGFIQVRQGGVVVLWSVPTVKTAVDTIIAYEAETPKSGGYVLMQDGTTVKKLTAEEFQTTPKAAELPSSEKPQKK
ncbi:hypothetical protein SAMN05444166_1749 [Singulisphaera sp. GP187]|uniref:hypothetical protein n=1 Tax=Singulisphaera sp. GP187 TaxID=1882752 RepID=UPI000929A907|nr:hypothetical protein [Singulisphaera sp. GP187]SIN95013.1 hypothetical protein SAMN05444166_1749 [Singulisphaera sp. GP187]